MKTNDYTKAKKAVEQNWTTKRAEKQLNEQQLKIYVQIKDREKNKQNERTVKQFADNLISERLKTIAEAMPTEGYSMGGKYSVSFRGLTGVNDCRQYYSKSCKYSENWGGYNVDFSLTELVNTQVIGGLVTYIYPNQRNKVKKCYWYTSKGSKQHFQLIKQEGYIYAGYHSLTKDGAKIGGERNLLEKKQQEQKQKLIKKALRYQFTFDDSIKAGNCEAGTRAFILRCNLSKDKKYRGSFLLKIAREKSTSSVRFVERMIEHKAKNC